MTTRKQSCLIYQIILILGSLLLNACGVGQANDYVSTAPAPDHPIASVTLRPSAQPSLTPLVTRTPKIDRDILTPTPTHSLTPTLDLTNYTNSWVRYTDGIYEISIEYPLIYREKPYQGICDPVETWDGIAFGEKSTVFVRQPLGTSLDEHVQSFIASYRPEQQFEVVSQESIQMNSQPAIALKYKLGEESETREFVFLTVPENRIIYTFSFIGGSACDVPEIGLSERTVFEHALGTFYVEK